MLNNNWEKLTSYLNWEMKNRNPAHPKNSPSGSGFRRIAPGTKELGALHLR